MADKRKRLTLSILQFLNSSLSDGSISSSEAESVQIAIQCISEAFGVSLDNPDDLEKFGVKGTNLMSIFEVYLRAEEKRKGGASGKVEAPEASASTSTSSGRSPPSQADKTLAESHKSSGNSLMASKDYKGAIDAYGKAIDKDPTNAVYYSNRAAAYSQIGDHASAIEDALEASKVDPKFSKAYSRLGHALFSSGKYSEAVKAYEKGLELDPTNQVMRNSLATARSKVTEADEINPPDDDEEDASREAVNNNANPMANLFGGGGMPDLAGLMNNPAVMQMAQNMMANGGLEQIMNNPMLRNMAESFGRGGGMPDMSALMNDPTLRNMAEQFGRGMGRGSGN